MLIVYTKKCVMMFKNFENIVDDDENIVEYNNNILVNKNTDDGFYLSLIEVD